MFYYKQNVHGLNGGKFGWQVNQKYWQIQNVYQGVNDFYIETPIIFEILLAHEDKDGKLKSNFIVTNLCKKLREYIVTCTEIEVP